jgi:ssDNA-binding Zn-finger/Zn-ribbon topoisomerase 1
VLRDFWREFSAHVEETKELRITDVLDALNEQLEPLVFPAREDGSDPRICPKCGTGKLSLKLGRYGSFVGCSNYPECNYTRQLGEEGPTGEAGDLSDGPKVLGPIRTRKKRSRCARAASAPMCSAAKARKPSAPACRRAGRSRISTTRRRWRCWRCRAMSARIPRPAR